MVYLALSCPANIILNILYLDLIKMRLVVTVASWRRCCRCCRPSSCGLSSSRGCTAHPSASCASSQDSSTSPQAPSSLTSPYVPNKGYYYYYSRKPLLTPGESLLKLATSEDSSRFTVLSVELLILSQYLNCQLFTWCRFYTVGDTLPSFMVASFSWLGKNWAFGFVRNSIQNKQVWYIN